MVVAPGARGEGSSLGVVDSDIEALAGTGLVNLVAELEHRLTGKRQTAGLDPAMAALVPPAETYVLCLFDGLGSAQIDAGSTPSISASTRAVLAAPFPTTTTVALATVATGTPASTHGVIGHLMWLPELGMVVNTLKWVQLGGLSVDFQTDQMLPGPNLWERLAQSGVEPITVQPREFEGTPLSRALYRGCRFEPISSVDDWIKAIVELAAIPRRLIFAYLPQVDFAAHVWGRDSGEYREALSLVENAWSSLIHRLPPGAVVVGTADHGHIDYAEAGKLAMRNDFDHLVAYGDPRSVYLKGDRDLIEKFARDSGGRLVEVDELLSLLGDDAEPHPGLEGRLPDALVLAPPGKVLLPAGFDRRLIGYHGGLESAERDIPLLVGPVPD